MLARMPGGFVNVGFNGLGYTAMIAEGINGFRGQGIDGVRADERVDIQDIAVCRVFGAGACPEHALNAAPGRGNFFELLTEEKFLKDRIGDLCHLYGSLATQWRIRRKRIKRPSTLVSMRLMKKLATE